jgi:hypothetical protein
MLRRALFKILAIGGAPLRILQNRAIPAAIFSRAGFAALC